MPLFFVVIELPDDTDVGKLSEPELVELARVVETAELTVPELLDPVAEVMIDDVWVLEVADVEVETGEPVPVVLVPADVDDTLLIVELPASVVLALMDETLSLVLEPVAELVVDDLASDVVVAEPGLVVDEVKSLVLDLVVDEEPSLVDEAFPLDVEDV